MTSVGNRIPYLLISGPPPYQLGHEILQDDDDGGGDDDEDDDESF